MIKDDLMIRNAEIMHEEVANSPFEAIIEIIYHCKFQRAK